MKVAVVVVVMLKRKLRLASETLEVCAWEERGDPLVVMKDGGRVEKGRPKREGVKELK